MPCNMNNIINYCNAKNQAIAQDKNKAKRVYGSNDATITKAARYRQYLNTTKPVTYSVATLLDSSNNPLYASYLGLIFGPGGPVYDTCGNLLPIRRI